MSYPHPALLELAVGRDIPPVSNVVELVRSAKEHRMSGLLLTAWSGRPEPEQCWMDLDADDLRRRRRHKKMWATLEMIAGRMGALGIELGTAKGVTAEARWYGQPGQRPCGDLDLFVGPDDLVRADEIVAALDPKNLYLPHVKKLVAAGVLQSVDLVIDDVAVDLHFDILKLGIPCRQRDLIWKRTQQFALENGACVRVLDPEVALIHFLIHLNKDRFRYLLGFVDIVRLLAREQLDWRFILSFLETEGLCVPTVLALETVLGTLRLPSPIHHTPRGWRATVWNISWRPAVRLQGDRGAVCFRHRQELLGLLAPGRACQAIWFWTRRFLFPPLVFVDEWYPNTHGAYLWRLASGRTNNIWGRLAPRAAWLLLAVKVALHRGDHPVTVADLVHHAERRGMLEHDQADRVAARMEFTFTERGCLTDTRPNGRPSLERTTRISEERGRGMRLRGK